MIVPNKFNGCGTFDDMRIKVHFFRQPKVCFWSLSCTRVVRIMHDIETLGTLRRTSIRALFQLINLGEREYKDKYRCWIGLWNIKTIINSLWESLLKDSCHSILDQISWNCWVFWSSSGQQIVCSTCSFSRCWRGFLIEEVTIEIVFVLRGNLRSLVSIKLDSD